MIDEDDEPTVPITLPHGEPPYMPHDTTDTAIIAATVVDRALETIPFANRVPAFLLVACLDRLVHEGADALERRDVSQMDAVMTAVLADANSYFAFRYRTPANPAADDLFHRVFAMLTEPSSTRLLAKTRNKWGDHG